MFQALCVEQYLKRRPVLAKSYHQVNTHTSTITPPLS